MHRFLLVVVVVSSMVSAVAAAQDAGPPPGDPPPPGGQPAGTTSQAAPPPAPQTQPPPAQPAPAPAPAAQPAPAPQPTVVVVREEGGGDREREDEGRDDVLYLELLGGYSYVDLAQFSQNNFYPSIDRFQGSGYFGGAALGFRFAIFRLGARATIAKYADFDLGTATAELQLRLPIPGLEPFARVGVGYGWVGAADYSTPAESETSVYGLVVDVGGGLDLYLSKSVSIGAGIDAVFLNLTRQRVDMGCTGTDCMVEDVDLQEDGDAVGLQMRAHGHLGLHF